MKFLPTADYEYFVFVANHYGIKLQSSLFSSKLTKIPSKSSVGRFPLSSANVCEKTSCGALSMTTYNEDTARPATNTQLVSKNPQHDSSPALLY